MDSSRSFGYSTVLCRWLFAALMTLSLMSSGLIFAQATPRKAAGDVSVVRNPKEPVPPPGGPSRLELAEEVTIGKTADPSKYEFASLRSVAADAAGNIWTLDYRDVKIRVFDAKGAKVRELGVKGQGPGEMQSPGHILVRADGQVMVKDSQKILVLGPDGRLVKEIPTTQAGTLSSRVFVDSQGFIYGDVFETEPERQMVRFLLKKFDPEMKLVGNVASREVRMPEGVDPFMPRFVGTLDPAGRVKWAVTAAYEIQVLDPAGKLVGRIVKDYEPVPITDQERKRIIQERFGGSTEVPLHFEPAYPPIASMVGDDEGRLYIRTYARDAKGGIRHDVFDAEGRYILKFALPEEETVSQVRNGKMYVMIAETEEGIPLVKRYGMTWK